jgi:hypothetical protein
MILFKSADEARPTRYRANPPHGELNGWTTRYFGFEQNKRTVPADPDALLPVAYLIETDECGEITPHFHRADQFQVIVGGEGLLGKKPVSATTVHYANAYTPYGPIVAKGSSIHFFTLRNGWDPGGKRMPQSRVELKPVERKYVLGEAARAWSVDELAGLKSTERAPLIAEEPSGLSAMLHRLPPNSRVTGPDPATGRGQFWLVTSGSVEMSGQNGGPRTCLFVSPEETACTLSAGEGGAEILIMQFPLKSPSATGTND